MKVEDKLGKISLQRTKESIMVYFQDSLPLGQFPIFNGVVMRFEPSVDVQMCPAEDGKPLFSPAYLSDNDEVLKPIVAAHYYEMVNTGLGTYSNIRRYLANGCVVRSNCITYMGQEIAQIRPMPEKGFTIVKLDNEGKEIEWHDLPHVPTTWMMPAEVEEAWKDSWLEQEHPLQEKKKVVDRITAVTAILQKEYYSVLSSMVLLQDRFEAGTVDFADLHSNEQRLKMLNKLNSYNATLQPIIEKFDGEMADVPWTQPIVLEEDLYECASECLRDVLHEATTGWIDETFLYSAARRILLYKKMAFAVENNLKVAEKWERLDKLVWPLVRNLMNRLKFIS